MYLSQFTGTLMIIGVVILSTLATHHSKERRKRKDNKERLDNWNNKGKKKR